MWAGIRHCSERQLLTMDSFLSRVCVPVFFLLWQIAMLAQRYALIHQRVVRHDLFRPSSDWHLNPASAAGQLKITPIESLLGQKESHTSCSNTNPQQNNSHVVLLLGILLQIEQGVYYLEDPTGQVQITLQDAVLTDGSFLTEHSMILVEGHVRDGVVHVHRIGQPLQETRALALRTLQQQVSHPAFAFPARIQKEQDRTTFCILQDVHMDQPRVVQQLECLFAYHENTLEGSSVTPAAGQGPPIFVLMGNFCSPQALATIAPTPAALSQLVQAALDDLQALILAFPTLAAQAHFVIVPGPLDSINRVLPFPPLIMHSSSSKAVDNIHWASNPCRIRWNAKEMVIFRFELLPLLLQHQIRLPSDAAGQVPNEDDCDDDEAQQQFKQQETHLREPHCRLLKTILDQGTLMPLTSVVPVYWNVHHALGLYPLPHCLILGGNCMGDGAAPSFETYHECHVIQTTSLSHGGPYAVYRPGANNSDGLKQDDDDDYSADSEENYAQGNDPARQGLIEFLLPDSSDLNLP